MKDKQKRIISVGDERHTNLSYKRSRLYIDYITCSTINKRELYL